MQAVKKLKHANKYVCIHTHTMWYQHIHCSTLRSTGNNLNVYVEGIDLVIYPSIHWNTYATIKKGKELDNRGSLVTIMLLM